MPLVEASQPITWKDRTAFLISAVLSPFVIIPIFIIIVTYAFSTNRKEFILFALIAIFFSTIVPFLNVLICVKRGKISDIHVAAREERKEPFIVALISIAMATLILHLIGAPREIVVLGLVMMLNGLIFFVITLFWKISMHSSILAGVLVSLMVLIDIRFVAGFAIIPLLIWARVRRQRHNFYQGLIASLLAALGTFLVFKAFGFPV